MPRKPRKLVDGGYYHLIARGNNRLFLFSLKEGFKVFKELLLESKKKFDWKLLHYCLMSNHFHLLARMGMGEDLPKLMQYLLFEYSRWYRKETDYAGHVWQGRYKSPFIEQESYLLECGRYIERNPIRAGLVRSAEDYLWSSYSHYALGKNDELIDENPYYAQWGQDAAARQDYYKKFVRLDGPYDKMLDKDFLEEHF